MGHPVRLSAKSLPISHYLFLVPDLPIQHFMPSSIYPFFIRIHRKRRARDSSAINRRPPTESSRFMIVKTFVIIAHGPMMIRHALSRVDWLPSTVGAMFGMDVDVLMSIM